MACLPAEIPGPGIGAPPASRGSASRRHGTGFAFRGVRRNSPGYPPTAAANFTLMKARILLFALEELRRRYGGLVPEGADPRSDTSPFRAFRERLLAEVAGAATGPVRLSMWWEGTYNGYCLAVACEPAEAVAALEAGAACPVEAERVAPPPQGGYPLARVAPGRAEVERDDGGAAFEAPFGAASGHFGAPGMRRIP